ncbi:transglycosylase SLT domain-containing protein [Shewanella algae]
MRRALTRIALAGSVALSALAVSTPWMLFPGIGHAAKAPAALEQQRQSYLKAREALDKGQLEEYRKLRAQLKDYPLNIYLDFHAELDDIMALSGSKALKALDKFEHSPLHASARHRYLVQAGADKRWQDFLTISPELPRATELQCYFYRAKLGQGETQVAWDGARQLWLYGRSRPKECDPLFNAWSKAGHRTQELIWSRMMLAFDAGQSGLLQYLGRKVTQHQSQAKLLQAVYKDPNRLRHMNQFDGDAPIYSDIVSAGLKRLARKDLRQAVRLYVKYEKAGRFSDFQGRQLNRYLVRRALIVEDEGLRDHIDTMLPLLKADDLTERRLRWAIAEQNDADIRRFLPLLNDEGRNDARWRYWHLRVNGRDDTMLEVLSKERNFYGFWAAAELGVAPNLAHVPTQSQAQMQARLADDKALARVSELLALDKLVDARIEWSQMLARHNKQMRAQYGVYAQEQGWDALAVEASIQARLWNDMEMRFPYAADPFFTRAGKDFKVNVNEIRAISRRESAFYPYATSSVGARGLMQLMPATAKQTAKEFKLAFNGSRSLYDPAINVPLGSAYYTKLLEQFDNNRVLAVAAYNAGPHRVKRWLKQSDGKLDVMSFIETIPFSETRSYVQAVFTYRQIYELRQQQALPQFSETELGRRY